MAKPSINKIVPFDANYDKVITMTYMGDMPYSNRIIVYDAETMDIVFDDTVASFNMNHTIPAYTLQNGVKYAIQGQAFDVESIASAISDKVYFWCFETPSFYFKGINDGDTIKSASLNTTVIYEQADWEDINEFQFHIYDSNKNLLNESSILYDTDDISYSFRGLGNENIYYIRCTGSTVNGMSLDTGYIKIFAYYENPNTYARIYAECDENTGLVNGYTNFKVIEASSNENYEYNNGIIDLIGKTLVYDKDFLIEGDFTITLRIKNAYHEGVILTSRNDKYGFTLSSFIYDEGKMRYKLTVPNGVNNYTLYSEELVIDNTDMLTVHIRRINNIYGIKCFVEYGYNEQTDMWFGSTRPSFKQSTQYDIWIDTDNQNTVKVNKDNVTIFYQTEEPNATELYSIWIGGDEQS